MGHQVCTASVYLLSHFTHPYAFFFLGGGKVNLFTITYGILLHSAFSLSTQRALFLSLFLRPSPALFQPSVISPALASLPAKHVHFFLLAYSTLFGGGGVVGLCWLFQRINFHMPSLWPNNTCRKSNRYLLKQKAVGPWAH